MIDVTIFNLIAVDHRKLWPVLRTMQNTDGDVGNICRPPSHVRGSENTKTRLQSHPEEQENNCC